MFLILLKITQLCLTKWPQGYDSGERSKATQDCSLVQYYMEIPPFRPYFPPFIPKTNQTYLPYFNFPCNSKHTFFDLSYFYVYSPIFFCDFSIISHVSWIHMNIKSEHMHIEPHGIRTMSKHQLRAEFGNLGHLAAAIWVILKAYPFIYFWDLSNISNISLISVNI